MARESTPTRASLLSRVRDPENDAAWREFEATYRDLIIRYCRARALQVADAAQVVSPQNVAPRIFTDFFVVMIVLP